LAVAAIFAQLVAATGAPVFSPRATKSGAITFPCQNHPCGCSTHDQCWAGDCCCFTLEEKLRWAEERGIEPPAHVRPLVESRKLAKQKKAKPSCCAQHEKAPCCEAEKPVAVKPAPVPTVKWVAGVFAQKCRGDGPAAGLFKFEVGFPPAHSLKVRAPRSARDFTRPCDSHLVSISFRPPIPPPRVS
jgi:hypothetical protein